MTIPLIQVEQFDSTKFMRAFVGVTNAMRDIVYEETEEACMIMIQEMQERIRRSPPHHEYYYPGIGWVWASMPGNPPRSQTGNLIYSFNYMVTYTYGKLSVEGAIINTAKREGQSYAHYLEYGTARMAARPYMAPVINSNSTHRKVLQMYKRRIGDRLKMYWKNK